MLNLNHLTTMLAALLSLLITFCSAAVPSQAFKELANNARDEWQPSTSSFVCLFLTSEVNWQGEAQNLCEIGGQCSGLLPDGLTSNVSSAGPTEGQTCFLYTAENCTGNSSAPISYPGYADLSAIGFLKKAVSWRCYKWCGYPGPVSTSTTTVLVTPKTMNTSAANAVAVTNRDVSISTTLSAAPTSSSSSSSSTVSISTTNSSSASMTTPASVLSPLLSPPTPISEMWTSSPSSSSSMVSVSTTLTTGTSSITPSVSTSPTPTLLSMLSLSAAQPGTGTGSTPSTSMTTYLITATHTYGGRGGSWTTLTTISIVEPMTLGATATAVRRA